MEFPAVSQSRIEFWKEPQYTQFGMWWFTLFFGFFGLHHVLLRSPQTAVIFIIVNICTLGYYWFYDLIQLSSYGGNNTESLKQFGMDHPWGAMGLAQGMWKKDDEEFEVTKDSPPNPWFFLLYALTVPFGLLSNLIAGDLYNALGRFGFLTIIPFGFIITFFAIFYDYWQMIGTPAKLLFSGTKRIFPWPAFMDADSHSPKIMTKIEVVSCPKENIITSVINPIVKGAAAVGMIVAPQLVLPLAAGVETGERIVDNAITVAKEAVTGAVEIEEAVSTAAFKTAGDVIDLTTKIGHLASTLPAIASAAIPTSLPSLSSYAKLGKGQVVQLGGGSKTPLDYLAAGSILALIAGGLLLTIGRKFSNATSA